MKHQMPPPDEGRLRALLRESRPAPDLPPGFPNAVWRRIERAEQPPEATTITDLLDHVVTWILRPRLALAGVAALLFFGAILGVLQGASLANDLAKQQYLAAVSPHTAR
jgi:hypothetical protein